MEKLITEKPTRKARQKLREEQMNEKMQGYDKSLEYMANTQTLVGEKKKTYQDMDTGELIHVDQISKRVYGTKQFWKVYLMDFLTVLGIIDSKQLDVFIYIAENTNQSNNIFLGTQAKIAQDVGTTRQTVAKILKKLEDNKFIKKIQTGAYQVNPNIMMKGNDTKRQILLNYYEAEDPINEITLSRTKQRQLESKSHAKQAKLEMMKGESNEQ